jgi:hypothetical protein
MQNKMKAKERYTLSRRWDSERSTALVVPRPLLLGCAEMGVVGPRKLGSVSLTLRDWAMHHRLLPRGGWGSVWSWMVRLGLLFFETLKDAGSSKTLMYVSHFVKVSNLGYYSLSISMPWFSATGFPNSLISPH